MNGDNIFTDHEISSLRAELLAKSCDFDYLQYAEVIEGFLRSRGFGVSHRSACESVSRLEIAHWDLSAVSRELGKLAIAH